MKIALCLHGLIGSKHLGKSWSKHGGEEEVIEKCASSFSKHFLSKMDVDVFFHTWSTDFEDMLVDIYKPKKIYRGETDII